VKRTDFTRDLIDERAKRILAGTATDDDLRTVAEWTLKQVEAIRADMRGVPCVPDGDACAHCGNQVAA
jgi:hypothetical protein